MLFLHKVHYIKLNNLPKKYYNELIEFEKYRYLLTIDLESELRKICKGDEILMDSLEELKNISQNSILMDELEKRELEEYCNKLALEDAHNDGKELGLSEGKKSEKIEIACRMLEKQSDISFISECTGLSIDEIKNLK